jgi:hypothetical protein
MAMDDSTTQQQPTDEARFVERLREQLLLPLMLVVGQLAADQRAAVEAHEQLAKRTTDETNALRTEIAALTASVAELRNPDADDTAPANVH